jgi:hypothetical protein
MVQRPIVVNSAAPGERRQAMAETSKVKRRPDAMTAIKSRMLRCSGAKADHGRFKRGYLATAGCGGAAVDSTVFFYLACIVCTPRPSVSIGVQELK